MSQKQWPKTAEKPGHVKALRQRRSKALQALLAEPTVARAAVACGVPERTLRRWTRQPGFRSAWLRLRRETFGQAIGLTQRYAPLAVATLVKVMNDQLASPAAKVTAAAVMLKFAREGIELDDLAERVEALERGVPPLQIETQPGDKVGDQAERKP